METFIHEAKTWHQLHGYTEFQKFCTQWTLHSLQSAIKRPLIDVWNYFEIFLKWGLKIIVTYCPSLWFVHAQLCTCILKQITSRPHIHIYISDQRYYIAKSIARTTQDNNYGYGKCSKITLEAKRFPSCCRAVLQIRSTIIWTLNFDELCNCRETIIK